MFGAQPPVPVAGVGGRAVCDLPGAGGRVQGGPVFLGGAVGEGGDVGGGLPIPDVEGGGDVPVQVGQLELDASGFGGLDRQGPVQALDVAGDRVREVASSLTQAGESSSPS